MRRAVTYVAAWAGATTLAVLLVWFGARPALHHAVFGPPARPVVDRPAGASPSVPATRPSPAVPRPAPPRATRSRTTPPAARRSPAAVRGYPLTGGRVVLSMTQTSARLLSATPDPGYEVRTWNGPGWLRVDFTRDGHTSSLFATWNGHPPSVQVVS